ncbi:MAG: zf-HC2 domain-containing protein [Marinobacter sp.]|uniref:zf-HC2 domain-containing protein n=1 Tax=Marinobacter sp. TaxID=50741 RepID=UPI003298B618
MLMCRELARIASDYIDDELGTAQKLAVKMHLIMCEDCRSFIGNLRTSTDLIKAHSSGRADPELVRRIDEQVAQTLNAKRRTGDFT